MSLLASPEASGPLVLSWSSLALRALKELHSSWPGSHLVSPPGFCAPAHLPELFAGGEEAGFKQSAQGMQVLPLPPRSGCEWGHLTTLNTTNRDVLSTDCVAL